MASGGLDDIIAHELDNQIFVARNKTDPSISSLLTRKELGISKMLATAIAQDCATQAVQDKDVIIDIPMEVWEPLIAYFKRHNGSTTKEIEKPLAFVTEPFEDLVEDKWDAELVHRMPRSRLKMLMEAANYLDIPSLLDLCVCKFAYCIRDMNAEQIKTFMIRPEEPWEASV